LFTCHKLKLKYTSNAKPLYYDGDMNMNMFNINKFYYSLYNLRRFQGEGSNGYTTDCDKLIKLEIQIRSIFFNSRYM